MSEYKNDTILFYYKKRVLIINEQMRRDGYGIIRGEKIYLTDFVDILIKRDILPEQDLMINDPAFDENVPYILMHESNPNLPKGPIIE